VASRLRAGDDRRASRAGDDDAAHRAVYVDDARHLPDGDRQLPGAGGGDGTALGAARVRRGLQRCGRANRLSKPVLVLRPFGRVRDVLPVRGGGGRGGLGARPAAILWLSRIRRVAAGLHGPFDERLGPSHVHYRPAGIANNVEVNAKYRFATRPRTRAEPPPAADGSSCRLAASQARCSTFLAHRAAPEPERRSAASRSSSSGA
jgi:hypothetical protein